MEGWKVALTLPEKLPGDSGMLAREVSRMLLSLTYSRDSRVDKAIRGGLPLGSGFAGV